MVSEVLSRQVVWPVGVKVMGSWSSVQFSFWFSQAIPQHVVVRDVGPCLRSIGDNIMVL